MHLIRPEVLASRQQSALGSVDLTTAHLGWPLTLITAVFLLALGLFLALGTHTRSQQVTGQLVPEQGLISVLAPSAGTLVQVLVREGDSVTEGQPLLGISRERELPGEAHSAMGAAVSDSLKQQRQQLHSQLEGIERSDASQERSVAAQLQLLQQRRQLIDQQAELKRSHVQGVEQLRDRILRMPVGALTALQIQQHEAAVLDARAALNQVALQRVEIEREIEQVQSDLRAAKAASADRRRTIELALAELRQASARNDADRGEVIRAPRTGVVSGIYANAGQSLASGRRLLTLTPADSVLLAELWLASDGVAAVSPGMPVAMRYRAYPYRQYGLQRGRVRAISGSAHSAEEIYLSSGLRFEQAMFRVLVEPDLQWVPDAGRQRALRSGMYVDADLLLETRPLYRLAFGTGLSSTGTEVSTTGGAH